MEKKIAVMGNIDHGKTTLISAISLVFKSNRVNCSGDPFVISRTETKVRYCGEDYLFFDYPNDEGYEKNIDGTEDGAVLVVAGTEGPLNGTERAIEICKERGIKNIIVFLNSCDLVQDDELLEIISFDVEDLLCDHGFENCRFVNGSAYYASMDDDRWTPSIKELVGIVAEEV